MQTEVKTKIKSRWSQKMIENTLFDRYEYVIGPEIIYTLITERQLHSYVFDINKIMSTQI